MAQNYINPGRKSMCAKEVYAEAAKIQGEAADATNKALAESGVPPGMPSTGDGNRSIVKVIMSKEGNLIVAESPLFPLIEMAESCGDVSLLRSFRDTLTKLLVKAGEGESRYYLALLRKNDMALENVQKHNQHKYNFHGDVHNVIIGGDVNTPKE